jgi:RND family efflux transporter MFP subunit
MQQRKPYSALAAAALAAFLLTGCGLLPKEIEAVPPPIEPPQRAVRELYTVTRGSIAELVTLRVTVAAVREEALFFRQAGRLKRVYVRAGDRVEAGQLLAELETGDLETQADLAAINVQKLRLRLEQARERAAVPGGPDQYDIAMLELDLRAADINLDLLRRRLADARIHAPFAGDVTAAAGSPGENVQAFQPVVTVSDPTAFEIRSEVDEATAAKLAPGQPVQLSFPDLGGAPVDAQITQAGGPAAGRRLVRIVPDSPPPGLRRGMTGRAAVTLQAKPDVLVLPHAAIRTYVGRTYVLVQEGNSRREADIVTGIVGETETEIVRGLREGQQVIGR